MRGQLEELQKKREKLLLGGGLDKIQKQHEKGKLSAWERVLYLLDEDRDFTEIGVFAADGQYEEHGGCPNAGVVVLLGYVKISQCVFVLNHATIKAGSWLLMTY